jgi:plastocyanin
MRTQWLMPTLCAASVLLASGCGSSSGGTSNNPPPPSSDILVQNDLFNPVNFSVAAGGTVTWGWDSNGQTHTVTSDDGSTFNSGQKSSGTFEHTFTTAGTFPYHCQIHPTIMKGTITVTAASGDGGSTGGGGTGGGGGGGSGGGGGGGYPYMSGARP